MPDSIHMSGLRDAPIADPAGQAAQQRREVKELPHATGRVATGRDCRARGIGLGLNPLTS